MTAAATTGPAHGPRPASSTPATGRRALSSAAVIAPDRPASSSMPGGLSRVRRPNRPTRKSDSTTAAARSRSGWPPGSKQPRRIATRRRASLPSHPTSSPYRPATASGNRCSNSCSNASATVTESYTGLRDRARGRQMHRRHAAGFLRPQHARAVQQLQSRPPRQPLQGAGDARPTARGGFVPACQAVDGRRLAHVRQPRHQHPSRSRRPARSPGRGAQQPARMPHPSPAAQVGGQGGQAQGTKKLQPYVGQRFIGQISFGKQQHARQRTLPGNKSRMARRVGNARVDHFQNDIHQFQPRMQLASGFGHVPRVPLQLHRARLPAAARARTAFSHRPTPTPAAPAPLPSVPAAGTPRRATPTMSSIGTGPTSGKRLSSELLRLSPRHEHVAFGHRDRPEGVKNRPLDIGLVDGPPVQDEPMADNPHLVAGQVPLLRLMNLRFGSAG